MGQHVMLHTLPTWWQQHPPQRIVIVGPSGSGKTTLGKTLGQLLHYPAVDLDDLHWLPNWQSRRPEDFLSRVTDIVAQEQWILAGNYSRTQALIWPRAELVIWLDFPLPLVFWRIIKRCLSRSWTGEMICNGNQESVYEAFFSPNSLLRWLLKTYSPHRKRYQAKLQEPEQPPMLILRSPADTNQFQQLMLQYGEKKPYLSGNGIEAAT